MQADSVASTAAGFAWGLPVFGAGARLAKVASDEQLVLSSQATYMGAVRDPCAASLGPSKAPTQQTVAASKKKKKR